LAEQNAYADALASTVEVIDREAQIDVNPLKSGEASVSEIQSVDGRVVQTGASWWREAVESAQNATPGDLIYLGRQGGQWNSIPFATQKVGNEIKISFPTQKPAEILKPALGALYDMAEKAGYVITSCTTSDCTELYKIINALKDTILGAYVYLKREDFHDLRNPGPTYEKGWNVAQAAAIRRRVGVDCPLGIWKVPMEVNIAPTGVTAWQGQQSLSVIQRISGLIRATAGALCHKLNPDPRKYFYNVEYFLRKNSGKSHAGGLLHDSEAAAINNDAADRQHKVESAYAMLASTWDGFLAKNEAGNQFSIPRQLLSVPREKKIQEIERHVSLRYSLLSHRAPGGKNRQGSQMFLVSGTTLHEKIRNSPSVNTRDPLKIIWSPLWGIDMDTFVEMGLAIIRRYLSSKMKKSLTAINQCVQQDEIPVVHIAWTRSHAGLMDQLCEDFAIMQSSRQNIPGWANLAHQDS